MISSVTAKEAALRAASYIIILLRNKETGAALSRARSFDYCSK